MKNTNTDKLKTYRDLLDVLLTMPDQTLDQSITVYTVDDEYISIQSFEVSNEDDNDVLDHDHLYLDANF